jgi:hypothetical protein
MTVLLLSVTAGRAHSVSVGGRILDGVSVVDTSDRQTTVLIEFTAPMQYTWHFPKHSGSEFLVALRPINVNLRDSAAYDVREHLRAPLEETDLVKDITYDGGGSEGPSLIVQFNREVTIEVSQKRGIRSLVLTITPKDQSECTKSPADAVEK